MPAPLPMLPENNTTICLVIPDSPEFRQLYMGALVILQKWWYYDTNNEEAAEAVIQRVMDCHYLTTQDYEACYMDCQDIIDCIETTEELQQLIAQYGGSSNIDAESEQVGTNLASELVNNPAGCNADIIFGMTTQLVEFADRLIKDLFEQIAASQLASVNIGYLIKLIPMLETLPLDEMFEFADKVVNDMETAYLSTSTQLLKDAIACDLLCLAQDNDCVLTLEMIRDYFEEKADITFTYFNVLSFVNDWLSGEFVGNAVYYGMNILFFQIFAFGGKFLEYFFSDYLRVINSMFNDPNSDWDTLCDECPDTWLWDSNFPVSENIFNVVTDSFGARATWALGTGYSSTLKQYASSPNRYMEGSQIQSDDFTPTTISSIVLNYDLTKGTVWDVPTTACVGVVAVRNNNDQVSQSLLFSEASDGNGQTIEVTVPYTDIKRVFAYVRSSLDEGTPTYSGTAKINSLTIMGADTNPFE